MKIYENARIYTLDPQRPTASTLVVDHGRILAVGGDETRREYQGKAGVEVNDMQGRVILPGLTDAHIHLEMYAHGLQKVDCETEIRAECLRRVAERTPNTPLGKWVLGHGWNQNNWPEGFGTAADLDAAAPDHPVYLTAKSLHAGWANTAALRAAGIDANTPDPPGGRIGRDEHGAPDGILYENAMGLMDEVIPEPSVEETADAIRAAQANLRAMGLTGVHDFDGWRCWQAVKLLEERGELRLRVVKGIRWEDLDQAVAQGLATGFGDDQLRTGQVKLFADGALGPHTAAMLEPYADEADNHGMLLLDADEVFARGRKAVEHGFSLAVHAIGDRANREVLDGFERLRAYEREHGLTGLRHRIEHVQVIHPTDAPRLAQLGIIASMQPVHAPSDMLMADRFWGARARCAYAWQTQLKNGAVLAFGSDAPVESPNPWWGLHAAVTRRRADGSPGPQGWIPEERIGLEQALKGFTAGAAYAAGMEESLGRLAPGYLADWIVLEEDPFEVEAERLREVKVVEDE